MTHNKEDEGGYPLPRKRLAEIQNELINQGALGVGWVISFPQPDRFDGDIAFAESLASAPSILATFENENGCEDSSSFFLRLYITSLVVKYFTNCNTVQ